MKNGILRQLLFLGLFAFMAETACAQLNSYRELHKVKRKETIFGIAKDNGLTIEELIKANPEMNTPGYELKKGEYIYPPLFYALICRGSYDEGIDTYMPELCPLLYQHSASIRFHTPHSRHHGNLHPHAGNDVRKHTAGYNSA